MLCLHAFKNKLLNNKSTILGYRIPEVAVWVGQR